LNHGGTGGHTAQSRQNKRVTAKVVNRLGLRVITKTKKAPAAGRGAFSFYLYFNYTTVIDLVGHFWRIYYE
jgi:hypothetical protein